MATLLKNLPLNVRDTIIELKTDIRHQKQNMELQDLEKRLAIEILSHYRQIAGKEEYAQCNEHYRIIWRLRKKINIPIIILERNQDIEYLPFCSGPEVKKSIKKYNSMLDLDLFYLYTSKMIKFLTCEKIDFFKRKKRD